MKPSLISTEARRHGKTVMTVKSINDTSESDSDDDDNSDESDESMQMDVSEGQDVAVSDDNSSIDLVTQPSKKKKLN